VGWFEITEILCIRALEGYSANGPINTYLMEYGNVFLQCCICNLMQNANIVAFCRIISLILKYFTDI